MSLEQLRNLLAPLPEHARGRLLAEALAVEQEAYQEQMDRRAMYDEYVAQTKRPVPGLGPAPKPMGFKAWSKWFDEQGPWDIGRGTVLRDPERKPQGAMARGMYDVGIEPTGVQRARMGMPQKTAADLITDEQIESLGAKPNMSMAEAIGVLAKRAAKRY